VATLFTDDFNRADTDVPHVGVWSEVGGDWAIDTQRLQHKTTLGGELPDEIACIGLGDVLDVAVTVTQVNSGGNGGPLARYSGQNLYVDANCLADGYAVQVYSGTAIEIYRYKTGVGASLLRTATITQVANGVIRLEVTGSGATVTLKQFYNGVQQGADAEDTGPGRITVAGFTGVHSFLESDTPGGVGDYDNFLVQDFTAVRHVLLAGA
jgi:hypothetical protein